jgi:hypothetical protein
MTTLRTTIGRPTLAGGMTLQPASGEAGANQLYLVVEATLLDDAAKADNPKPAAKPARSGSRSTK